MNHKLKIIEKKGVHQCSSCCSRVGNGVVRSGHLSEGQHFESEHIATSISLFFVVVCDVFKMAAGGGTAGVVVLAILIMIGISG